MWICNVLVFSPSLLLDRRKKQARGKKKGNIKYKMGYTESCPSQSSEMKNELKTMNKISVQLCSENTQKTEVRFISSQVRFTFTTKSPAYNTQSKCKLPCKARARF